MGRSHGRLACSSLTQRRYSHTIATLQPKLSFCSTLVDTHFTFSNCLVNARFGHTKQVSQQPIIKALTRLFIGNCQQLYMAAALGTCIYFFRQLSHLAKDDKFGGG
jgi:hypothetical protein